MEIPDGDKMNCVAWAPDGSKIATAGRSQGAAKVIAVGRLWRRQLTTISCELPSDVQWAPNSAQVAVCDYKQSCVRVVDTTKDWGGEKQLVLVKTSNAARVVAWSPDSLRFAVGDDAGQVLVVEAGTGTVVSELTIANGTDGRSRTEHISALAWSPDGTKLAVGSGGHPKVVDAMTGEELLDVVSYAGGLRNTFCVSVKSFAWSPDGKRLAVGGWTREDGSEQCFEAEVLIVDSTSGAVLSNAKGVGDALLAWSPRGSVLAVSSFIKDGDYQYISPSDIECTLYFVDPAKETCTTISKQKRSGKLGGPQSKQAPTWSADGLTLVLWEGSRVAFVPAA